MKNVLYFLISLLISFSAQAQDLSTHRVKILADDLGIQKLGSLGFPVNEGIQKKGAWWITDLYQYEIDRIKNNGFTCEILIPDVDKLTAKKYLEFAHNKSLKEMTAKAAPVSSTYPVPVHFSLGSVGGFCTLDQLKNQLDSMVLLYPNLVTAKQPLTNITTIEGRSLYYVKISKNPNINENEPQVLYTGMHHAREAIGMQANLFFMWYLLENYATDSTVQYILDHTELYFVPMLNPDGYAYNELTNPNGGGNWRKNRRDNGNGNFGIDINRNYGYMWGIDDVGSSPDPSQETYRGAAAFSEAETQNVRDFCNAHQFRLALNYHSYSNLLLWPWGYTYTLCPDDSIFAAYAPYLITDNHFTFGPGASTIYQTNGGSDDWMYGEQTSKPMILSYTPEVGNDGFWPPVENIIPYCQENVIQNLYLALFADNYAVAVNKSPYFIPSTSGYFKFEVQRLGIEPNGTYTVSIQPISNISSIGPQKTFSTLGYMEKNTDSIAFSLNTGILPGTPITYLLTVSNGAISHSDTIRKIFGAPFTIFNDNCTNITNWTGNWNITTQSFHSPNACITDSPSGTYNNNVNSSTTMNTSVSLVGAAAAILNFWAKWDIEAGYDYVQVKASKDNGVTWIPLTGQYTKPGSINQTNGTPVYDGIQNNWVFEEINLQQFVGYNIKLRFTIISDQYTNGDGFYFDDLSITKVNASGVSVNNPSSLAEVSQPVPNPAKNIVRINTFLDPASGNASLEIYNQSGQMIFTQPVNLGVAASEISITNWADGLYFYRLKGEHIITPFNKFIVIK